MLLDDLYTEINNRLAINNSEIIVDAFERIIREISELADLNKAIMERSSCSYSINFNVYKHLRTRLTHVWQMLATDSNDALDKKYQETFKSIESLKPLRYIKVCKKCPACLSRRKQWPEFTNFVYHVPLSIENIL